MPQDWEWRGPCGFRISRRLVVGLIVAAGVGCGSTKLTGTPRTGTEQLLLSTAWDQAVRRVDFRPLAGVPVYLDTTHVTSVDQGWVVSSIRQALLENGVLLRAKAEEAQWVVEARVGAYGTDEYNFLIGIPQTTIPGTFGGLPSGTIPEIPVMKKSDQKAVAKLALFAYERSSGQIVWSSGTMLASANEKNVYVGGLGPIQSGSIRGGSEFMGTKLPTVDPRRVWMTPKPAEPPGEISPEMAYPLPLPSSEPFDP